MNVVAVVVTYNRLELLKRNLSCLRRQTVPLTTLVVVDNGSTDGTGVWLDEQEDVKTIHQTNVGGAGGFIPEWSMLALPMPIGFGAWMTMFFRVRIVWSGYWRTPDMKV